MKLHLPKLLRVALMGLVTATSPFALTVATASSAIALFGVVHAAEVEVSLNSSITQISQLPELSDNDTLKVTVADKGESEIWEATWATQVKQNVTSIVTVGENATLNIERPNSYAPASGVFRQGDGKTQTINLCGDATMNTSVSLAGWDHNQGSTVVNMAARSTWNMKASEYMNKTSINMTGATINISANAKLRVEREKNDNVNTISTTANSTQQNLITSRSNDGSSTNGAIQLQNWNLNLNVAAGSFHEALDTSADLLIEVAILQTDGGNSKKKICKTGNGILELTHAGSDYDGGTQVDGGTLRLAGAGGKAGTGEIEGAADTTLELAHTQDCTTENNITGFSKLIISSGYTETVSGTIGGSAALSLARGKLSLTGSEAHFSSMRIDDGTTLCTSAETDLHIASTIENSGALEINGAIYIDNVTALTPSGDVSYTDGANGFMAATYYVYNGGTATIGEGVKVHVGGSTYDLDSTSGTITGTSEESGRYYVNTNLTYGAEGNSATAEKVHSLVLGNGVTLTLATGLKSYTDGEGESQQVNIITNENTTINIGSTVSLDRESVVASGHTVTLAGTGTYVAGNENWIDPNITPSAQVGTDWKGIVKLSGNLSERAGLAIDTYTNSNSKLCLAGVTAWLKSDGSTATYTSTLILGDGAERGAGLELSSVSDRIYKFSGGVSGKGIFEVSNGGGDTSPTFCFSGNVSDWEGLFKSTGNAFDSGTERLRTLKFSDNATTINADVENAGTAKLAVVFENDNDVQMNGTISNTAGGSISLSTSGSGTKIFSSAVIVDSLRTEGGKVVFNNTLTINGASVILGDATVSGRTMLSGTNGSITIGNDATFNAGDEMIAKLTEDSDTIISGEGVVSVATAGITYTNAAITVATGETLATAATLDGSKLTVTGGGSATSKVKEGTTNSFDASAGSVVVDTGAVNIAQVSELTVGDNMSASFTGANNAPSTAEVSGTASLATNSLVNGNLTITNGATLQLNGAASDEDNASCAQIYGKVTFADGAALSLQNKVNASGITTPTDFVLAWAAEGFEWATELSLDDVIISGTLEPSMKATLVAVDLPAVFAYSREAAQPSAAQQLLLKIDAATSTPTNLVATSIVGYNAENKVLTIGVGVALEGISGDLSVTIGDELWKSLVADMGEDINKPVSVTLSGSDDVLLDLTNYDKGTVALNGYTGTGTQGVYVMSNVPEPATVTLSLLALAALAARRRRKRA